MLLPDGKERFPAPGEGALEAGMLAAAGGTKLNDPDGVLAPGVLPPLNALPLEELEPPNPVPLAGGTAPQTGRAVIRSHPVAVNKAMLERHLIR
jgi:hypothetical protein